MKFLIIGTGGTGGAIGGFLALQGYDVTFIARGSHLDSIKRDGLKIKSDLKGEIVVSNIHACEGENYTEQADVIFVCVKSYSLRSVLPLIKRAAHNNTIVIPILNGIGFGDKIAEELQEAHILDGCIYIVSYLGEDGEIVQMGNIFKVVFGSRANQAVPRAKLKEIEAALAASGIEAVISQDIERDTFLKFSFISPYASCGAYFNIPAREIQRAGAYRQLFIELVQEIKLIAKELKISLAEDILGVNLKLLDSMEPETTASLQKDIQREKETEVESLIFQVVDLGSKLGLEMPNYRMVANKFGY